ncbi:MAG: hypothetical protein RLZZ221_2587 [Verrucomicrobiota bacterium]
MSGVGTLVISTRETLLNGTSRRSRARLLPPKVAVVSAPSIVMPVLLPGKPRIATVVGSEPEVVTETPGRKSRNSPMFSLPRSPNSSIATTFLMFGAARCSFMATAWALISRASVTVKASSFTASVSGTVRPARTRLSSNSRRTVVPAVTLTAARAGVMPRWVTAS